jgi:CMP-N,N'-diacetyllegionaminic acid synthase
VILGVIPARGGSKGIPQKNLQLLGGSPIVAHSIRHALAAQQVDRVVVSTDDPEIAAVAAAEGAEIVKRPADISGDSASSESAIVHVLDELGKTGVDAPELVVFLQATSPIRRPEHIDGAIGTLRNGGFDSVFSASPIHGFVWEVHETGEPVPLTYDPARRPMRQEAGDRVAENGSIYVFKTELLRGTGLRIGGRIGIYRMGFLESLQIDSPQDLELARRLFEQGARLDPTKRNE